ncbi:MAG: hypothetical protein K2X39_09630 [Silvanigrellaceae bacterium]|nr:hypothetical protein [Silvanigrellaceae bacterium]
MELKKEKVDFDFEEFKNQAIADMKAGKSLIGKDGVFTPLMKEFLEAALEGEMNSHMALCIEDSENQNRRNGKSSKTVQSPMGSFTSETALFKLIYCACQKIAEKWTSPLQNWALTISQLDIYFEGRLKLGIYN